MTNENKKRISVKKVVLGVIGIALVVSIGACTFNKVSDSAREQVQGYETRQAKEIEKIAKDIKSGDSEQIEMSKHDILETMNQMTHQKVKASEKWGAVEMNETNINAMITVVEENEAFEKETLLEILYKWKAGDFSEIVADHNTIWKLQDGTIGEAHDVMNEEEEREFIKNTFRD